MDIVFLLVPLSALLVLFIVIVLWWAIYNEQFEDLDTMAVAILDDDALATATSSTSQQVRSSLIKINITAAHSSETAAVSPSQN